MQGKILSSTGSETLQVDLGFKVTAADKNRVQAVWDKEEDSGQNLDPELKRRLLKAGARVGDVTLSLMWDNATTKNDLDIWVDCGNYRGTISFSNPKVGGGSLDVDARADVREPVENVFWDMAEKGTFTCTVENYSGPRKEWLVCLRSKVPITILNEDGSVLEEGWSGARQVRGVCEETKSRPFAFKYRVDTDRKLKDVSGRPPEVISAIHALGDCNLVVIDSSKISGWDPRSLPYFLTRIPPSIIMHLHVFLFLPYVTCILVLRLVNFNVSYSFLT